MLINVPDPFFQTLILTAALVAAIFLTLRKLKSPFLLSIEHTNQLKGLAIMMVIFSHIGYFLDAGKQFSYPWSVAGGVGVDIFLFLSGFGLTMSALKTDLTIVGFYLKRLPRIYLPMWIVVLFFLVLDIWLLNINYPIKTLSEIFIGINKDADIYSVLNSPLWYFTYILFYYLIFPIFFWKRAPLLSAAIILSISIFAFKPFLPVTEDVLKLYRLHLVAFPFGMAFGVWESSKYPFTSLIKRSGPVFRYLAVAIFVWLISYYTINSGVGQRIAVEEELSLLNMMLFILLILFLPFKSNFLIFLGIYSYEIYLIQWPLLYRYDFLYKYLPAGIATILYFVVFIAMSVTIQKIVDLILKAKLNLNFRKEISANKKNN